MATKHDGQIQSLLDNPTNQLNIPNRPKTILSRLFWSIVTQAGIHSLSDWDDRLRRFCYDPDNEIEQTVSARATERGNLLSQLLGPNMSISSFFKAMRFLRMVRWEITLVGVTEDNRKVKGKISVNMRQHRIADDEAEEDPVESVDKNDVEEAAK